MKHGSGVLIFVFATVSCVFAGNLSNIAKQLDAKYKLHPAVLRTDYEGANLQFDDTGRLIGTAMIGNPISSSALLIRDIRTEHGALKMDIQRAVLVYDRNAKRLTPLFSDVMDWIWVEAPAQATPDSVEQTLNTIFDFDFAPHLTSPCDVSVAESAWTKVTKAPGEPIGTCSGDAVYYSADQTARPEKTPDPEYSETDRRKNVSGTVTLRFVLSSTGTPAFVQVMKSVGANLTFRSVAALGKWRFQPAMKDGKPVDVILRTDFNFHHDR